MPHSKTVFCIDLGSPLGTMAICHHVESGSTAVYRTELPDPFKFAESLLREVSLLSQQAGANCESWDAILVSEGPGSFTGLRIGLSTVKAIAMTRNIPLESFRASEMRALAWSRSQRPGETCNVLTSAGWNRHDVATFRIGEQGCKFLGSSVLENNAISDLLRQDCERAWLLDRPDSPFSLMENTYYWPMKAEYLAAFRLRAHSRKTHSGIAQIASLSPYYSGTWNSTDSLYTHLPKN